jgi:hypothetical protein
MKSAAGALSLVLLVAGIAFGADQNANGSSSSIAVATPTPASTPKASTPSTQAERSPWDDDVKVLSSKTEQTLGGGDWVWNLGFIQGLTHRPLSVVISDDRKVAPVHLNFGIVSFNVGINNR